MKRVDDIGEDALIVQLLSGVPLAPGRSGPGDDCAVVEGDGERLQLLKTDAMVEGVHWQPGTDAERVGWKAVARVISDFAAMGGRPADFLITVALPADTPVDWAIGLYRGIGRCLETYGGRIVGGETSGCPMGAPIFLSVAASGEVRRDQLTLRSGAKPGDVLLVSGLLGGSLSGKHLDFSPRMEQAGWLTSRFKPSAMMDLSDGLARDLPRLAAASDCGVRLFRDAIPRAKGCSAEQALNDGEDYELLFAIGPDHVPALLESWQEAFRELPLTAIGELCDPSAGEHLSGGWEHFGAAD